MSKLNIFEEEDKRFRIYRNSNNSIIVTTHDYSELKEKWVITLNELSEEKALKMYNELKEALNL